MQFSEFQHQVAGHKGTLVNDTGTIFAKPSTEHEVKFYEAVYYLPVSDNLGDSIRDWMPCFLGRLDRGVTKDFQKKQGSSVVVDSIDFADSSTSVGFDSVAASTASASTASSASITSSTSQTNPFLVLQNLLAGFVSPCVLDIKLGSVLVDPQDPNADAAKHKRLAAVAARTTSGSLGFRISGMKIANCSVSVEEYRTKYGQDMVVGDADQMVFSKVYGKSLTKETVKQGLQHFFFDNKLTEEQKRSVVDHTMLRLQCLYNCLIDTEVRMFSSSLLIVFETDSKRWNEREEEEEPLIREFVSEENDDDGDDEEEDEDAPLSSLHLIDFAHSRLVPGEGPDDNVLDGIKSLMDTLEEL